ncbi:MAG: tyrosine--tRNA ligase [Verrucomicrobiota bacterium]|nr:tyrosine--tRNA ligase [Verrucomicrobiota bacterium]
MSNVHDTLHARGLVSQITDEELPKLLSRERVTLYTGFDPTAASLHLGHLVPIMCAAHFQRAGHRVILVVGGATGMVGDPGGKSSERNLLTREQVETNTAAIKKQLSHFVTFEGDNPVLLLDNHAWIGPMTFIDWLREVGKHFTINYMLQKDSVQSRLGSDNGISYTEFSYMTMQAYDFLHLYETHGCRLQCGGSDQWGNITAGTELIRKKVGGSAFGLTYPLIMGSNGQKFGKSSGAAVWLDSEWTTPFAFYQYLVRTEDADIENFLKYFTFVSIDEIASLMEQHKSAPEKRVPQKRLAEELTRIVHGEAGLARALKASEVLFGGGLDGLGEKELRAIFADVPSHRAASTALDAGIPIVELLIAAKVCPSKNEARRALQAGGLYLNNQRIEDPALIVTRAQLAAGNLLVLRSGRKNYTVVEFGE